MRNIAITAAFSIVLISCTAGSSPGSNVTQSDTTGVKNPDGVVNSNVISTDSTAWKVDSTAKKKEVNKH